MQTIKDIQHAFITFSNKGSTYFSIAAEACKMMTW